MDAVPADTRGDAAAQERASGPFLALDSAAAEAAVTEAGGRPFHARIARREILQRGVLDFARMTSLPRALRERLALEHPILCSTEEARTRARDGTVKLLLAFARGGSVETVWMPARRSGQGATVCVSTQVGCPVGCPFCASGKLGLERNLEAHEILEQYLRARALGPLARSVVMGIGEPLLNYANVSAALDVVHDELSLGARKVTLSSVGFPERLRRIAPQRPRFQLAISLHSPFDEERGRLVPAMRGVSVREVLEAGDDWFRQTGREVTYEYVLLGGLNDTPAHASALAELLAGRRATMNLIPYNPIGGPASGGGSRAGEAGLDPFRRPSPDDAARFQAALARSGIVATVRWSRGVESDAACGQLRIRARSPTGGPDG
jgi:23S rRNA (adenine2503-C2)-methyltransferase